MNSVITFINGKGEMDTLVVGPGHTDVLMAVDLLRKAGYTVTKVVRPKLEDVTWQVPPAV